MLNLLILVYIYLINPLLQVGSGSGSNEKSAGSGGPKISGSSSLPKCLNLTLRLHGVHWAARESWTVFWFGASARQSSKFLRQVCAAAVGQKWSRRTPSAGKLGAIYKYHFEDLFYLQ